MMNVIEKLDVADIANEISMCPEEAWEEVREWITPTAKRAYSLYKQGIISNDELLEKIKKVKLKQEYPDESIEQDRLHLLWQMTEDGSGLEWWDQPDWRDKTPQYNKKYIKYFPITVKLLTDYFGDRLLRMFFSRLQPGKQLYPHSDGIWGENFNSINRYGLVITTNDNCNITVDGIAYQLETGTLFEFDNSLVHSAVNMGTENRVVLYADVKILD